MLKFKLNLEANMTWLGWVHVVKLPQAYLIKDEDC